MKIFVAGLPFAVRDQELQEIFEPYGSVSSAKVILDKETRKSRGFGFVEFSSDEEGEKAIKALDGSSMGGRTLTVKVAENKPGGGGGGGFRGNSGGGYGRDRNRY
ncbi:MAG TPA: RNA-binding protein [Puia sp.]|nr:RNA-binding protein [Puia sp.]